MCFFRRKQKHKVKTSKEYWANNPRYFKSHILTFFLNRTVEKQKEDSHHPIRPEKKNKWMISLTIKVLGGLRSHDCLIRVAFFVRRPLWTYLISKPASLRHWMMKCVNYCEDSPNEWSSACFVSCNSLQTTVCRN